MATFCSVLLVSYLACSIMLASALLASKAPASAPTTLIAAGNDFDDWILPPEPMMAEPTNPVYMEDCYKKLGLLCSAEIYAEVMGLSKVEVSEECCLRLVNTMGMLCHMNMVKFIAKHPDLASRAGEFTSTSALVWNGCVDAAALKNPSAFYFYP